MDNLLATVFGLVTTAIAGWAALAFKRPRTFMRMSRVALEAVFVALVGALFFNIALQQVQDLVFQSALPDVQAVAVANRLAAWTVPGSVFLFASVFFFLTLVLRRVLQIGEEEGENPATLPKHTPGMSPRFWQTSALLLALTTVLIASAYLQAARELKSLEVAKEVAKQIVAEKHQTDRKAPQPAPQQTSSGRPTNDGR